MRKKLMMTILMVVAMLAIFSVPVAAQGIVIDNPADIGLKPITIPTFLSLQQVRNFSLISYISLVLTVICLVIVMIWIVMVIRGALLYLQSKGDEGMIATGQKKITNVFISISILFVFIVVISVVASWLGVGNFWEWPRAFSYCNSDFSKDPNAYYFQYYLKRSSEGATVEQIDRECYGD